MRLITIEYFQYQLTVLKSTLHNFHSEFIVLYCVTLNILQRHESHSHTNVRTDEAKKVTHWPRVGELQK